MQHNLQVNPLIIYVKDRNGIQQNGSLVFHSKIILFRSFVLSLFASILMAASLGLAADNSMPRPDTDLDKISNAPKHTKDTANEQTGTILEIRTQNKRDPILPQYKPLCWIGCYKNIVDPKSVSVGNFGLPGIIDMPSAQRLPDGELILTQQLHKTLARSGMSFQLLPRLGVAFRYSGHGTGGGEANGRVNHDRSFDAHLSLIEQSTYLPSVAIGLRDFIGTGWYSSEYVVGTKTVGPFNFTAGLGFGRLAGINALNNPLSTLSRKFKTRDANEVGRGGTLGTINWFQGKASPFAGLTYQYNHRLRFAMEYSPDRMVREARYLAVSSQWNFGAQYRINDTVAVTAHYLHGSTLSLGAKINLNPKRSPNGPGKETAPIPMRARGEDSFAAETDKTSLSNILRVDGFHVLNLQERGDNIRVDLKNTQYRSYAQALGRASATIQRFSGDHIKNATVVFYNRGLAVASYTIDLQRVSGEQFTDETTVGADGSIVEADYYAPDRDFKSDPKFGYGIGPYFAHRLFNPDLPLSFETGLELGVKYDFTPKLSMSVHFRKSLLSNFTDNKRLGGGNEALPPVQTNWGFYDIAGQDGHINDYTLSYLDRLSTEIYARAHAGLLEPMFAGVGGELLYMPKSSPFAFGLDIHYVRQRDYDMLFDLQNFETTVGKLSVYYDDGGPLNLEINAGKYLAGDWGATTRVSRRFANGWEIGAYATFTNVPFDEFGEGSFDKGFYVTLPLDWLTGSPSMSERTFTIRPITRDGGARLASARQLYGIVRDAREKQVLREQGRIWK
ncbi:MAG: YjbH domain-containing protein [Bacteroidetes bacterium]|nr:YjbH domain-containing protein [Bacteroidota bacterium]